MVLADGAWVVLHNVAPRVVVGDFLQIAEEDMVGQRGADNGTGRSVTRA